LTISQKNAQFKDINSVLSKKYSIEKLTVYLVIMSNLTHLQGRNAKVKLGSRILEQIYVGPETESGSGTN
jgi:hypothetical protein